MIKKFVGLYDIHYPNNIKLDCVESFMVDFAPDYLIYGGDTGDWEPLSHWGEENRFKEIGLDNIRKQLNKEADGLHKLIKKHNHLTKPKEVH